MHDELENLTGYIAFHSSYNATAMIRQDPFKSFGTHPKKIKIFAAASGEAVSITKLKVSLYRNKSSCRTFTADFKRIYIKRNYVNRNWRKRSQKTKRP